VPDVYGSPENWKARLAESAVRLQWDPDHDPAGGKHERRAIQLGLDGDVLCKYAQNWIVRIEDISGFVAEQRAHAVSDGFSKLVTPREEIYPVNDPKIALSVGLDPN
jgi:hypothetical protein